MMMLNKKEMVLFKMIIFLYFILGIAINHAFYPAEIVSDLFCIGKKIESRQVISLVATCPLLSIKNRLKNLKYDLFYF